MSPRSKASISQLDPSWPNETGSGAGKGKPETFTFLGFTHYCGKRRSDGTFIVWRKTAKKRMVAKLRAIKAELVRRKHDPSAQVGEWLTKVLKAITNTMLFPEIW